MKALILVINILTGSLFTSISLQAQDTIPAAPCKEIDIAPDENKQRILNNFIQACLKDKRFVNDKGIVQLNIYKNSQGLTCWLLIPHIDDSYKDNPPPRI